MTYHCQNRRRAPYHRLLNQEGQTGLSLAKMASLARLAISLWAPLEKKPNIRGCTGQIKALRDFCPRGGNRSWGGGSGACSPFRRRPQAQVTLAFPPNSLLLFLISSTPYALLAFSGELSLLQVPCFLTLCMIWGLWTIKEFFVGCLVYSNYISLIWLCWTYRSSTKIIVF